MTVDQGSPTPRPCAYCGALFTPRRTARWCSDACRYRSRDGVVPAGETIEALCTVCGEQFDYVYAGTGARRRLCGSDCAAEASRSAVEASATRQGRKRVCVICGGGVRGRGIACSPACHDVRTRQNRHAYRRRPQP